VTRSPAGASSSLVRIPFSPVVNPPPWSKGAVFIYPQFIHLDPPTRQDACSACAPPKGPGPLLFEAVFSFSLAPNLTLTCSFTTPPRGLVRVSTRHGPCNPCGKKRLFPPQLLTGGTPGSALRLFQPFWCFFLRALLGSPTRGVGAAPGACLESILVFSKI